jgi:hypothetical protein
VTAAADQRPAAVAAGVHTCKGVQTNRSQSNGQQHEYTNVSFEKRCTYMHGITAQ